MTILSYSNVTCSNYGGNFVESLCALQRECEDRGDTIVFAFPKAASSDSWINSFRNILFFNLTISEIKENIKCCSIKYGHPIVHINFVTNWRELIKIKLAVGSERLIFHFHNHIIIGNGVKGWIKKIIYYLALCNSHCITVSDSIMNNVTDICNHMYVTRIYNGIEFNRLKDIQHNEYFTKTDECTNLLIYGNHARRKGVDLAALAIQQLNWQNTDFQLYIAVNDIYMDSCSRFILDSLNESALPPYIHIIPTRNDIGTYLCQTDIFLAPSREEGFSYAIDEAAFLHCSIVASKCGGQNENIVPGIYWIDSPSTDNLHDVVYQLSTQIANARNNRLIFDYSDAERYVLAHCSMLNWVNNVYEVYYMVK